jgi:hypothetical protein
VTTDENTTPFEEVPLMLPLMPIRAEEDPFHGKAGTW